MLCTAAEVLLQPAQHAILGIVSHAIGREKDKKGRSIPAGTSCQLQQKAFQAAFLPVFGEIIEQLLLHLQHSQVHLVPTPPPSSAVISPTYLYSLHDVIDALTA